jgi:hypothetical protein
MASAITSRSIQRPARHAASVPSGTANVTASTIVTIESATVGSMRWPIISETGRLVKIDTPMLPCRLSHTTSRSGRRMPRSSPS